MQLLFANRIEPPGSQFQVQATLPSERLPSYGKLVRAGKRFGRNHLDEVVSVDFFTVSTLRLRVLFVFLVLKHRRRGLYNSNVTDDPTS
jgi:hypothetical protein